MRVEESIGFGVLGLSLKSTDLFMLDLLLRMESFFSLGDYLMMISSYLGGLSSYYSSSILAYSWWSAG